ncbi:MAG: hypothetical protein A2Y07_01200 [Planctomycetes bacterium GWF2_50_10]|nr:MAG: hypothetical protein A2Y07_01200 [Planctomycetes bacterium GWF2_50_10]
MKSNWLCKNGCGVVGAVLVDGRPLCWKCYLGPQEYRLKFEAKFITYRMPKPKWREEDEKTEMQ